MIYQSRICIVWKKNSDFYLERTYEINQNNFIYNSHAHEFSIEMNFHSQIYSYMYYLSNANVFLQELWPFFVRKLQQVRVTTDVHYRVLQTLTHKNNIKREIRILSFQPYFFLLLWMGKNYFSFVSKQNWIKCTMIFLLKYRIRNISGDNVLYGVYNC